MSTKYLRAELMADYKDMKKKICRMLQLHLRSFKKYERKGSVPTLLEVVMSI